jgi:DNA-binding NarL/FixJ family response regulator
MKKLRLLLADDHTILLEGLKALLAAEFEVVATAADGRAVLEAAEKHQPDLILLDITMPGLNGIEAARRLKEANPDAKLIILTMHPDLIFVSAAFEAGASGYVLKQSAATELLTALHAVDSGRRYISSLIRKRLGKEMDDFLRQPKKLSKELTPANVKCSSCWRKERFARKSPNFSESPSRRWNFTSRKSAKSWVSTPTPP